MAESGPGRRRKQARRPSGLEVAGLVVGTLELSGDGKAMMFYEVAAFDLHLNASALAEAAKNLTKTDPEKGSAPKEDS